MKTQNVILQNREIRFEVTNKCNARCIMCPREKMTRAQGILTLELYKKVLDEAHTMGANVVSLENYGETFIDPFFLERAMYAKSKRMQVYTITNGSLLTNELADKLLPYIDKIRFSVYGTTQEIYEKIHIGLRFDEVMSNIDYMIRKKKASNTNLPKIEIYFLLMEENKHQMESFKEKWLGVADDISIWKPHNWSDGRKYRELASEQKKITCGRPEKGPLQVQWDGLVVPCCFDYNSNIILGNLNKQTLKEIVASKEYAKLRNAHVKNNFSNFPFCDSCDQLRKREDVLGFSTIRQAQVGAVNTTYDKVD